MMIIEIQDKVPTVVGGPVGSFQRKAVQDYLGTPDVTVCRYQGSPIWCRDSDVKEIETYWDGKYLPPEEHFT